MIKWSFESDLQTTNINLLPTCEITLQLSRLSLEILQSVIIVETGFLKNLENAEPNGPRAAGVSS